MNVRDYYKKDVGFNQKLEKVSTCRPLGNSSLKTKECSFADAILVIDNDEKMKLLSDYGYKLPETDLKRNEAQDFINEYPVFLLKAGMTICHSTKTAHMLSLYERQYKSALKSVGWWNEFFVGQSKYNGGWFTYESEYGGPPFGMLLYYRVLRDTPVLFVPNYRIYEDNKDYFPDKDILDNHFTGSHIVYGVQNWKEKGYEKIVPKYYADEFAKRLIDLGFFGYISCDECEVFLSHKTMQKSLYERPYRIVYQHPKQIDCRKCNKKQWTSEEKCRVCNEPFSQEDMKTIFHHMIEALCPANSEVGSKQCPLKINEGDRETLDVQVLSREQIEKILPWEEFNKKFKQIDD